MWYEKVNILIAIRRSKGKHIKKELAKIMYVAFV